MPRPTTRPSTPYTTREILDLTYAHFVDNRNPCCVNTAGTCVYSGTGCAVGHLITAEDAAEWEGRGIDGVYNSSPESYHAYFTDRQLPLLNALQSAHDNFESRRNLLGDDSKPIHFTVAMATVIGAMHMAADVYGEDPIFGR